MIRQKTEQYVCVCIWAMLLAIGSIVLADQKLLQFIMEESYKITERDLLNVIFMTDQFGMYPYLNKSDIGELLPIFSFYTVGVFVADLSFLSKSKEYYNMIFSRVQDRKHAIKYMKKGSLKKIIIFVCSYTIFCYVGMRWSLIFCFHAIQLQDTKLFLELILHAISAALMLLVLQKITLFGYIKWNAAPSFMEGLTVIVIILLLDMQMKRVNLILFSPVHFYLDSIGILGGFNIILYIIETVFLHKNLSFKGV